MADVASVKITVLRKIDSGDIRENYAPNIGECKVFKVGDEFIVDGLTTPQGFCPWAWAGIFGSVMHLALNGDFSWMKRKGTMITCCTNGLRPVVFKLERIED